MNYIWEMMLKLEDTDIRKDNVFFKQAVDYSPYYEQAFLCMNQQTIEEQVVEINSLYRFNAIFNQLLSPYVEESEVLKMYLFDILIHYLVEIDLRHGLSKKEYYIRKLKQSIEAETYGGAVSKTFHKIKDKHQMILCEMMIAQFQGGASIALFAKVVKAIFPEAIVYKKQSKEKQVLVYLGEKVTKPLENTIGFIIDTFLPMDFKVRLFWEHHFAIIDVEETLKLGAIEII